MTFLNDLVPKVIVRWYTYSTFIEQMSIVNEDMLKMFNDIFSITPLWHVALGQWKSTICFLELVFESPRSTSSSSLSKLKSCSFHGFERLSSRPHSARDNSSLNMVSLSSWIGLPRLDLWIYTCTTNHTWVNWDREFYSHLLLLIQKSKTF